MIYLGDQIRAGHRWEQTVVEESNIILADPKFSAFCWSLVNPVNRPVN